MKLEPIIKGIKAAGFGYVKVELEAEFGRPDEYDHEREECSSCSGHGLQDCIACDGEGAISIMETTATGTETGVELRELCDDCEGSGTDHCEDCDGEGYIENENTNFGSEDACENWLLDRLSPEARAAVIFARFYDDGSVDSELTFTIAVENIKYLPEFIEGFQALGEAIDNDFEIDGAGMHIAIMKTETGGKYPNYSNMHSIRNLSNFQTEVTKLLPALFVAACSGDFTRELGYRQPRIDTEKYSAIHIINEGFEYRVFETCYQRPEAIFEFLGTIERTLQYYADPGKKVPVMNKDFAWYNEEGMAMLTSTPDQVQILKKQLRLVTPTQLTLKEMQQRRGIKLSLTTVRKEFRGRTTELKRLHKEHVKAHKAAMAAPLSTWEQRRWDQYTEYGYFDSGMTEEQKIAKVKGLNTEQLDEDRFIQNNMLSSGRAAIVAC